MRRLCPLKNPRPALKHIALLLRAYLEREGINASELGRQVGGRSASITHPWLHGRLAPSSRYRPKLAALLEVDELELLPREGEAEESAAKESAAIVFPRKALSPTEAEVRALEAHLQAPPPAQVLGARKPPPDVLTYTVASDGQSELRVVARGPHVRMAAVFRMLLDAGLVPGGEEEDAQ